MIKNNIQIPIAALCNRIAKAYCEEDKPAICLGVKQ